MFNPDLGPAGALIAVAGCLARIFGSCLLLAFWGGFSAWAWTSIASRFWRMGPWDRWCCRADFPGEARRA
jgi:hypothetical protein